ncbi:MAG: hypothetical protein EAZ97_13720 [Bacteroidetes bacterium]|nr:MAG: hypothetical protein EAZ97_13720 [Bacteroidota bacterium]
MKKIIVLLYLWFALILPISAQNTVDSLKKVLQTLKISNNISDTLRVQTLNNLAFALRNTQISEAAKIAQEASELAKKINYPKGLARSLGYEGLMAYRQGKYDFAITFHHQSLKIANQIADSTLISFRYNDLANVYLDKGDLEKALEYNLKSLKIKENRNDKEGIATSCRNLGMVNLKRKDYKSALFYLEKAKNLAEQIDNQRILGYAYIYLGELYTQQKQIEKAIELLKKAVQIHRKINNFYGLAEALNSLAEAHQEGKNHSKVILFFKEALQIAQKMGIKLEIQRAYFGLSRIYQKQNRLNEALDFYQKYTQIKDSIFSEKSTEHIAYLEAQFQNEKKQAQIILLTKEQDLKQQEIEKERLMSNIFMIVIAFVVILVGILSFGFVQKRKTNTILSQQKEDLLTQNEEAKQQAEEIAAQAEELQNANNILKVVYEELQTKNNNIISSITYALRIQKAIIPTEAEIQRIFPESFVFFRPKDIVSGDFYYFADKNDKKIIAVADCTGHGVSGAFMTMICNNILNKIIHDHEIHEPDEILDLMPILLEKALSNADGKIKDGMDISILTIEKRTSTSLRNGTSKVSYAGAMNPLYYVQNKEFREIKADKRPIGGKIDENFSYQKHEISLQSLENSDQGQELIEERSGILNPLTPASRSSCPTTLYLFSDGFQDQFGGENDRKFMVGNFKKMLFEISEKTMFEQGQILAQKFDDWKGNYKQTDDVAVIGIKI